MDQVGQINPRAILLRSDVLSLPVSTLTSEIGARKGKNKNSSAQTGCQAKIGQHGDYIQFSTVKKRDLVQTHETHLHKLLAIFQ